VGHALIAVLVSGRSRSPAERAVRLLAPYNIELDASRRWRDYEVPSEIRRLAKRYKVPAHDLEEIARRIRVDDPDVKVDPRRRLYYLRDWNRNGVWDWYRFLRWDTKRGHWASVRGLPKRPFTELPQLWTLPIEHLPAFLITPTGRLHKGARWPERETRAVREWRRRLQGFLRRHRSCSCFVVDAHV